MPPPAPVIRSLAIAHLSDDEHDAADDIQIARGEVDAWPSGQRQRANDFAVELDLSDDTVFLDVVVRSEGAVDHQVIWREDLRTLGHSVCSHDAHVAAGTEVCLSIRAFDLAGNLGVPATRCTVVVDRPGDSRREVEPLRAFPPAPAPLPRWSAVAIAAALASWVASRVARGVAS